VTTLLAGLPHELSVEYTDLQGDAYTEVEVSATITGPDGRTTVAPAFWAGGRRWAARYTPASPGRYTYRFSARGATAAAQDAARGAFEVAGVYAGPNPLYRHGALRVSANRRYLQHSDGEPFFWLADTWWYGATRRCAWPEPFQSLARLRAAQGFTVIQLVVGIPPEIPAWDPAAENEGGPPFLGDWSALNPAYFDNVDRRLQCLIEHGLAPCVVGGWGHHLEWLGEAALTRYWRYLAARYSAYPVIWCLCGESDLFLERDFPPSTARPSGGGAWKRRLRLLTPRLLAAAERRLRQLGASLKPAQPERLRARRAGWERVGAALAQANGNGHPVTVHPLPGVYSHEAVNNAPWLTLTGIQSGHSPHAAHAMVAALLAARTHTPRRPIINLEPWYEGILGQFWEADQRYAFWMCLLAGAAGHSYGAHGLWQMSTHADRFRAEWGRADWREAAQLPGAAQLGLAKRLLSAWRWWEIEPQPEAITPRWGPGHETWPLLAIVGGRDRLAYLPAATAKPEAAPVVVTIHGLPEGVAFAASWLNPRTGEEIVIAPRLHPVAGDWTAPPRPDAQDWVLAVVGGRERLA